mgnify:CR=1 FL=1
MEHINFVINTVASFPYWVYVFRWMILALFPGAQLFQLVKRYVIKNDTVALVLSQGMTGCLIFFLDDKIFRWFFSLIIC